MKRLSLITIAVIIFAATWSTAQSSPNGHENIAQAKSEPKTIVEKASETPSVAPKVENVQTVDSSQKVAPATQNVPNCEQYRALLNKYEWDSSVMYGIMRAENRSCDTNRDNNSAGETHYDMNGNVVCVGSYGLFQMGCLHFSGNQNPNDPLTNIEVAYQIWKKQGYTAWTMYRNGTYAQFVQ